MNYKLLIAVLLSISSNVRYASIHGMDQPIITCKNLSKEVLVANFKELPQELKQYIIFLLIQNFFWDFQLYKTTSFEGIPSFIAFSLDGEKFLRGNGFSEEVFLGKVKTETSVKTFRESDKIIASAAFSPDGKRIIAGCRDKTACLWDSKTGNLLLILTGHTSTIRSVAFSPDGKTVLTGSWDKTACLWDSKTGKKLTTFKGHSNLIFSVAFNHTGEKVLTGSKDKTACLWNSKTGELLQTFKGHTERIEAVAFSSDGEKVLTASYDTTARVWDAKTGEVLTIFQGHTGAIYSIACSPDGKTVLTGSWDATACLWDLKTGEVLHTFKQHEYRVLLAAFTHEGEMCLTGSLDKKICIWKRIYGLSCLTEENKERIFKRFIHFYPLLPTMSNVLGNESGTTPLSPTNRDSIADSIKTESFIQKQQVTELLALQERDGALPMDVEKLEAFLLDTSGVLSNDKSEKFSMPSLSSSTQVGFGSAPITTETLAHSSGVVKERRAGLDINSGDQQNCIIS